MKAKAFLVSNSIEMENADKLGVEPPAPEFAEEPILFDIKDIIYAFINEDGDINANIAGAVFTLKWDKKVWGKLEKHFE